MNKSCQMYPPAGAGPSPIKITLILGSIAWIVAACRALAMIARYQGKVARLYFRADAAFAMPEVYEFLEAEGIRYTIRLPVNRVFAGQERPPAHESGRKSAERGAAVSCQLQLSH